MEENLEAENQLLKLELESERREKNYAKRASESKGRFIRLLGQNLRDNMEKSRSLEHRLQYYMKTNDELVREIEGLRTLNLNKRLRDDEICQSACKKLKTDCDIL